MVTRWDEDQFLATTESFVHIFEQQDDAAVGNELHVGAKKKPTTRTPAAKASNCEKKTRPDRTMSLPVAAFKSGDMICRR